MKPFLTLLSASLLVCSTVNAVNLVPTFKDEAGYKNIVFAAAIGGASHYKWVLSIGNELDQRGHNVSFLTSAEDVGFGQPYANVKTIGIGPAVACDRAEFIVL